MEGKGEGIERVGRKTEALSVTAREMQQYEYTTVWASETQ